MKYKKNILSRVLLLLSLFIGTQSRADEGMWLLALLKQQNENALKSLGLKIPIDKITGASEGTLSESVIAFGGGCTGSIISNSGLILTNYHCSYDAIQQHITPSSDIYKNGYWASNLAQELPVRGLSITINKKIVDISEEVSVALKTTTAPKLSTVLAGISKKYGIRFPSYKAVIKSYKNNSIFILFLQLEYNDVRLVGVPPKNVAKFGGETDNWMWPRQSADFAYFRVYANKAGRPASFSKGNIPLRAKSWLNISTAGYANGDFAMSMGYPGFSDRNALSFQIKEKTTVLNPPMISVRKVVQSIWEEEMNKNPMVKQAYAQKLASSANYYKNAVGMNYWVNKLHIIERKEQQEREWMGWAAQDPATKSRYLTTLQEMKTEIEGKAEFKRAITYYSECIEACEAIKFNAGFGGSFSNYPEELKKRPPLQKDLASTIRTHYKTINTKVDERMTKAMLRLLKDSLPPQLLPTVFESKGLTTGGKIDEYVAEVFRTSTFTDSAKLQQWLKSPHSSLADDPLTELTSSIEKQRGKLFRVFGSTKDYNNNMSVYGKSVGEFKANNYYPEADRTLRLSYGTISNLQLDNKIIPYQTFLSSLIAKADTVNKDYLLNDKLLTFWRKKDFQPYGINGDMPLNFITNGDVTGGNSGSPMLNADGKIIGLVFDCNWESMTREFNYEKDLHKVICVDIRYVLFVTEKFSGSRRIVDEIQKANSNQVLKKT